MNAFSTVTAATLLVAGAASVAAAQTQAPQQPADQSSSTSRPSSASSPHQRESTGTSANEAPAESGANPGAASSPHQHGAMSGGATSAEMTAAKKAGANPQTFVKTAAQDGMMEVELAKLAQSKSNNDEVKQFAQKMEQDHTQANQQLESIAKNKGITVPTKLDAKHEAMVKSLSAKSDASFDAAYARHMAKGHAKAVALFEAASKSSDQDLAAFAQKTLPTLEEHKQLADNLEASTGTRTASAHGGGQTR
jgi:putative membrane protein